MLTFSAYADEVMKSYAVANNNPSDQERPARSLRGRKRARKT